MAQSTYVFGQFGSQTLDKSVEDLSSSASQFQAGVGLKINERMAFEASWVQASHDTAFENVTLDFSGAVVGVRGFLPVSPEVTLSGKVGMTLLSADLTGVAKSDGAGLTLGLGAEYKVTSNLSLTASYDFYNKPADLLRDVSVFSVGVKYGF